MIEVEHREWGSAPIVKCDSCGERIDDAEGSLYVFEFEAKGSSPLKVVHKGLCDRKLEKRIGYRLQGSVSLGALPVYLLRNLNISYREAGNLAAFFGGYERIELLRGRTNGYVYILKFGDLFKIGCTQDVRNRMAQLQAALPGESELIHTIECEDHRNIEARLHKNLREFWAKGEWFRLPNWVIRDLKEIKYA